jgi:hypothetical protein
MRRIAFFMAIVLCFGILGGCTKNNTDTVSEISDTSSEAETETNHSTIVSIGKKYTSSIEASSDYADSYNSELTDGERANTASYKDAKYCGFNLKDDSSFNVTIDLENDGKKLYQFEIGFLATTEAGIAPPKFGIIYISDDGKDWKKIGSAKFPEYVENSVQTAVLTLSEPVDGRYIRFSITKGSVWTFLDELTVIANVPTLGAEVEAINKIGEAYANDNLTNEQRLSNLNKVSGEAVDRSKTAILVSKGRPYETSNAADTQQFADNGSKLTDGVPTGASFENNTYVGFAGGAQLDITITLDSERNDLADFELSMFSRPKTGITLPAYVDIAVSTDNSDYTTIGRVYATTSLEQSNYTYSLKLQKKVKGKYVRFTLAQTNSKWFLVEEAAVYAYGEVEGTKKFYPDINLPKADSKSYWQDGSKKNENLIAGLPYQIASGSLEEKYWQNNDPITKTLLTDGTTTESTEFSNGIWYRTCRGTFRNIYFDLTNTSTITGFAVNFLSVRSAGIYLPGSVTLYLSDDGEHWYPVKRAAAPTVGDTGISKINEKLDKPVQARFARISFDVSIHVYLDEIQVFGTKYVDQSTPSANQLGLEAEVTGSRLAPNENILGGANDILLAYHNSDSARLTKEVFLSYAGYVDKNGKILDTMFDGFLFLPTTGALPSGAKAYEKSIKTDWDYLLNNVFAKDINLDALNQAVGEIKAALGKPDYKVNVYYTILYPSQSISNFGDVDGDGVSENFSKLEDRAKAIAWYVDEFIKRFEQGNYENLKLSGFYWFHETINKDENDLDTIRATSNIVHERDYQLFWIPYFNSNGFAQWTDYGFDAVCLQPNYAFNADVSVDRIRDTADIAKEYNMCIEIEINSPALSDNVYFQRYMDYLQGGITYGYMNDSIHMYYQSVMDIYKASKSESAKTRLIYEYTYQFIKKNLKLAPDKLSDITIDAKADTYYEGKLFEADAMTLAKVSLAAQNGTVTVNKDGTFRYYPNKGFKGTDTFTFKISKYLGWSEDIKVTVNVG